MRRIIRVREEDFIPGDGAVTILAVEDELTGPGTNTRRVYTVLVDDGLPELAIAKGIDLGTSMYWPAWGSFTPGATTAE